MNASSSSEEWKIKGNEELKKGNIDGAIEMFTEGLLKDSNNAILYSNRAAAYSAQGKWLEALEDAKKAAEIRPNWAKAHSRIALALFKLQRFEEAIQSYNTAIHLDPSNSEFPVHISTVQKAWKASEQNVLGEEQLHKGKFQQAFVFFEKATELDPNCALYWSNICFVYIQLDQFDKALKAAENVISKRPSWHKGYQRKGEVYLAKGNNELAASAFATGLQIEPNNEQLNNLFTKAQQELWKSNTKSNTNQSKSTLQSIKEFLGFG